ncbi:hypothetical protein ILUMI_01943 [Ignelater luminosus]|uniref:Tyr recombinase domain-containing protein n=1 Tax=Ignelater luminosus TaxID=2038154 RepID=A0A8K0GLS3_IGNLU|nr:hypothetical protein ILUMI_01943 [Ignelater luminosus]
MESDSDESFSCTPEEIIKAASTATSNLLPEKSRGQYLKEYDLFMKWRAEKQVCSFTERVLLAYFEEKSKQWKSPTLWSTYSKLKSTLSINNNVDISKYSKLIAYLKNKSVGYKPRKSKTFSREKVYKFLEDAPDKHFLMHKVALIFGIAGALRREELYKMTLEDINDTGTVLIITIPDSKTHIQRRFTVIVETTQKNVNLIEIYRDIKPSGQRTIPSIVAKYLSLPNPDHYTGHAFRRSSASLLVDSGEDLIQLKKHGGWKSNAVAEGYVDESIQNKMDCANKIFTGGQSSRNTSNPASFKSSEIKVLARKQLYDVMQTQKEANMKKKSEFLEEYLLSKDLYSENQRAELKAKITSGNGDAAKVLEDVISFPTRAQKYRKPYSDSLQTEKRMSTLKALSMLVEANLSRRQYEIISASDKKLFPCYSLIQKAKQDCYPASEAYTVTERHAEINLQDLLDHTAIRNSEYFFILMSTELVQYECSRNGSIKQPVKCTVAKKEKVDL